MTLDNLDQNGWQCSYALTLPEGLINVITRAKMIVWEPKIVLAEPFMCPESSHLKLKLEA